MLTNIEERYSKLESIDWRVLSNFEQCLPTLNSALHNALQIWLTLFNLDKHSSKLKEKTFNFGEYSPYFFLCAYNVRIRACACTVSSNLQQQQQQQSINQLQSINIQNIDSDNNDNNADDNDNDEDDDIDNDILLSNSFKGNGLILMLFHY